MSQANIPGATEAAAAGSLSEFRDGSGVHSSAVLAVMRPKYQGVASTTSLMPERANEAGDVAAESPAAGRTVGLDYFLQLCFTSGPFVLADLGLLAAVLVVARQVVFLFGGKLGFDITDCFLPIATGFLLISAELGLYPGIRLSPVEEFRRLAMAVTSIFAVWAMSVWMMMSSTITIFQGAFFALAYGICLVSLPIVRGTLRRLLAKRSWWGFPTLVCGNDACVVKVYDWLNSNRRLGLRPVGVIADPEEMEIDRDDPWYAGPWSQTRDVAIAKRAYWAVVVPPEGQQALLDEEVAGSLATIPHIHILSDPADFSDGWAKHQQFEGLAGVYIQQNLMLPLPQLTKRCMDLVVAVIGTILLLPLLFYVAFAVKMSSRGPILYAHDRIGKDGRHFKAWKFRSMFENSSDVLEYFLEQHPELREEWEKDHKLRYDPRVTKIGRFIRKTSIDELPQLWNVIRGDMSLVGPRPIVTAEIVKYGPYYGLYTMVTPGITGLWQVCGRNNTTYDERVQLDSYYVRNWSPWMDLYLLIRTIRIVLFADGAY